MIHRNIEKVARYNEMSEDQQNRVKLVCKHIEANLGLASFLIEVVFFNNRGEYEPLFLFRRERRYALITFQGEQYLASDPHEGDVDFKVLPDAISYLHKVLSSNEPDRVANDVKILACEFASKVAGLMSEMTMALRGMRVPPRTGTSVIIAAMMEMTSYKSFVYGMSEEEFMEEVKRSYAAVKSLLTKTEGVSDLLSVVQEARKATEKTEKN